VPSQLTTAPPAGTAANLPGTTCTAFPADDIWHADVSKLPVDPRSAQWLSHMQASTRYLHPDFGPSGGFPYGIPVTVVPGSHAKVSVTFDYADESDPGPYLLGSDTLIEGGPGATGDRHAIVVDAGTCRLYETWDTRTSSGHWLAGSGATWDLRSDALRPAGWTSADAPPGCRSCPACCGTTRSSPATSTTRSGSRRTRRTAPTAGRHVTRPAR
jgi:hypothetical protein